jgi:protein phosphatase 1L
MAGKEIYHKVKDKVKDAFSSSGPETGKGKTKLSGLRIRHGYHLVKGKSNHPMEDYLVAEYRQLHDHDLGLFAIFDGHLGHSVPDFLRSNLFDNILNEPDFSSDSKNAIRKAYLFTDEKILEKTSELGRGGSTAVTAILIGSENSVKVVVANVGDSRAVISRNGVAKQLSVDHEPNVERPSIEKKGGFVSNLPGDVPRVDGQLAVARAFGDRSLKKHLSSEPHVAEEPIDENTNFLILASDGLWKVMSNQEAADAIKDIKHPQAAAKHLTEKAVIRKSKDDISCIVVKFMC